MTPTRPRRLGPPLALLLALSIAPAVRAAPAAAPSLERLLAAGTDVDEGYRARFDACDAAPDTDPTGFEGRRGCGGDANRARLLRRLPGGAVAWVSKLSVDLDGSPLACSEDRGRMDQCPTSLMLPGADGAPTPVDADRVPYVVIPISRPDQPRGEFTRLTGVGVGDLGVVAWNGRVVPVIVADTGPWPKLGEGSLALHRALGHDQCLRRDAAGVCRGGSDDMASIDRDVVTVIFPGSAPSDLTAADVGAVVADRAARLWAAYLRDHGGASSR